MKCKLNLILLLAVLSSSQFLLYGQSSPSAVGQTECEAGLQEMIALYEAQSNDLQEAENELQQLKKLLQEATAQQLQDNEEQLHDIKKLTTSNNELSYELKRSNKKHSVWRTTAIISIVSGLTIAIAEGLILYYTR